MKKIIRISTVPLSLNIFCKGLLRLLSEEYEVVAISSPGDMLDALAEREGIRAIAVPMQRRISPIADIKAIFRLTKILRRERPDMVHSITPKAGMIAMIAAKMARVPIRLHTFTGLHFPTAKGSKKIILKSADRIICACATHIVPEGEGVKADLINNNITQKPLQVLGYGNVRGVDLQYFKKDSQLQAKAAELRNSLGIPAGSWIWIFVGRLANDKGIKELVEAFVGLNTPVVSHLLLVGSHDESDPLPKDILDAIASNPYIHWVNQWIDDVRPYYAMANALVFPSYREGFPNVVLEAGAIQLPSIVTNINGSREIITHEYNGYIVEPKSSRELAQAMEKLLHNPLQAVSMGQNAHQRIVERFDQEFVRQCLINYYHQLIK